MDDTLDHQRMEVYQRALDPVVEVRRINAEIPRGESDLVDQSRRASNSIVLNIGEGAGEFAPAEKARFYRYAKRSATEVASVLDIYRRLELVSADELRGSSRLLASVVRQLTGLVKRQLARCEPPDCR